MIFTEKKLLALLIYFYVKTNFVVYFLAGNSASSSSTSNVYSLLRKRLQLTQDGVNEQEPNDITYVHR